MSFPASQIIGQSAAVRAAIGAHYYAARRGSRIIQPPPAIIAAGVVAYVGYVETTGHTYHLTANHHDPVMLATDFVVVVFVLVVARRLVRVLFSDPFSKELLDGT